MNHYNSVDFAYFIGAVMSIIMLLLGLFVSLQMKTQIWFQRAYVIIEGDFADQLIQIFKLCPASKDDKVDIDLVMGFMWKDKEGKDQYFPNYTRVTKKFFQMYVDGKKESDKSGTLQYLIKKIETADLKVHSKGYL